MAEPPSLHGVMALDAGSAWTAGEGACEHVLGQRAAGLRVLEASVGLDMSCRAHRSPIQGDSCCCFVVLQVFTTVLADGQPDDVASGAAQGLHFQVSLSFQIFSVQTCFWVSSMKSAGVYEKVSNPLPSELAQAGCLFRFPALVPAGFSGVPPLCQDPNSGL